ncbi:unnamed protein product [Rhizophagus irregularis]|nr:unnamed protein product [Rhizophagus irregularis]
MYFFNKLLRPTEKSFGRRFTQLLLQKFSDELSEIDQLQQVHEVLLGDGRESRPTNRRCNLDCFQQSESVNTPYAI